MPALPLALTLVALLSPPTPGSLNDHIDAVVSSWIEQRSGVEVASMTEEQAEAVVGDLPIERLRVDDLDRLFDERLPLYRSDALADRVRDRLRMLADDERHASDAVPMWVVFEVNAALGHDARPDGAPFREALTRFASASAQGLKAEAPERFDDAYSTLAIFGSFASSRVDWSLASAPASYLFEGTHDTLVAHAEHLIEHTNDPACDDALEFYRFLHATGAPASELKRVREALVTRTDALLEDATDSDQTGYVRSMRTLLDGDHMRGGLIGKPVDDLTILWSSDDAIGSIEDLRGKVVVVDFWATWCTPCIVSFPKLRALQSHYEGHDVVVLGVTSHQGVHVKPNGAGAVDCTDDPAKEQELMRGFMEELGMTWTVVFTEESCMNRDFGVSGIPHVAVIDPAGIVRHTGLTPFMPLERKALVIDALLEEFGLEAPPRPSPLSDDDAR